VGNHNNGSAIFVEFFQQVHYFIAMGGVEVTGRFIGQNDVWFGYNSTAYSHPLLLTTRELKGEVVFAVHDLHLVENFLNPFLPF
jgi:hypothetical protein